MIKVFKANYDGLTEREQNGVSNNGMGKEYAGYIVIEDDGERRVHSDAMEPEDALFCRNLSWVFDELTNAFAEIDRLRDISDEYDHCYQNCGNQEGSYRCMREEEDPVKKGGE